MNRDEQKQILDVVNGAVTRVTNGCHAGLDVEADAIIRALFVRNPEAAYRVTMLAVSQAQEIERLRAELSAVTQAGLFARLFKMRRFGESAAAGSSQQGVGI